MRVGKIGVDLGFSIGIEAGNKLLGFVVLTLLARYLSQDDFGLLMFALATCGLLVLPTELGTSRLLTRKIAAGADRPVGEIGQTLGLRLVLLLGYGLIVVLWAMVAEPTARAAILVCGLFVGLRSLHSTASAAFVGIRRPVYNGPGFLGSLVVLTLGVLAVTHADGGLDAVFLCYLVSAVWLTVVDQYFVRRTFGPLRPAWPSDVVGLVRAAAPFFGITMLELVHFRIDAAMIGTIRSYSEVATYETSARLYEASQAITRPLMLVFFPICAQYAARRDWPRLRGLTLRLAAGAALAGVALAALVIATAPLIVTTVFGSAYLPSAEVLRVHFAGVPALLLCVIATFVLAALHREGLVWRVLAAGVGLNVVLNAALIPDMGALGAAWATLVSQIVIALGLWHLVRTGLRQAAPPPGRPALAGVES